MTGILYSFGCGIAFSVGVVCGAVLCRLATAQGRKDFLDASEKASQAYQERLNSLVSGLQSPDDSERGFSRPIPCVRVHSWILTNPNALAPGAAGGW